MALLLFIFLRLMRTTMGTTKPETVKAGRTTPVLWEEVQGVDATKEELMDVGEWLHDADRLAKLGARPPGGVLLFDPKHISSGGLGGGGRLQILLGLASSSTSSSTLSMVLARLAIWWWCCLLGGWRRPPLPRPPARGRRPAAAALTRG
jgi:hypothetical protein